MFDRNEWLDPARYGYTPEETRRVAAACRETDGKWWSVWTERMEESFPAWDPEGRGDVMWVDELYGKNSGPCVVAGAGPSLGRAMDFVRNRQRAGWAVIAVDRAFGALKRAGVRPDLVVCCDAGRQVADFLDGFDARDAAAVSVVCHPDVARKARAGRVFRHAPLNPFSPFWSLAYRRFGARMATVRPGVVVTFSAVDIALWMGFDPVLTIGNELCYESAELLKSDVGERDAFSVAGGRVTHSTFLRAARAFRFFPRMHPEARFVDVSGGIAEGWEKRREKDFITEDTEGTEERGGAKCDGVN